jgi:3'(2'), 5'-bisphosphate nucleotidase
MAARAAGGATRQKADGSLLTAADVAADEFIRSRLSAVAGCFSVITEETFDAHAIGALPDRFILVDPLDGTREFAAGRDEFTVNIALVENGNPVVGAIYAPAKSLLYVAGTEALAAEVRPGMVFPDARGMRRLSCSPVPCKGMRVVASRSHLDLATKQWIDARPIAEVCPVGSSLKFCTIAEGLADVYPRLSPTMEWDIAAGHAIVVSAGGCVLDLNGVPLRYGKIEDKLRNGSFVVWGATSKSCAPTAESR